MRKFKKRLLIAISAILLLAGLVIAFISPITRYLIQKYDTQYTGRQIILDWAYVNPFTGYIHLHGLKIYEYKSDSVFIAMKGLSSNFEVLKLFSKTIEIKDFTLNQPLIIISKVNRHFNFDDLVTKFSSTDSPDRAKEPFHFSMLNIKIKRGHFYYLDHGIPVNFSIKHVDIESKEGWQWNRDEIAAKFSFLSEIGSGKMAGVYGMNLKSLDYKLDVKVANFDLKVIEQYLKGFANYGTLRANLNADLKTIGNYRDAQNITIKGELAVNDFHFGKNPKEDYLSFDKVVINIREVNPAKNKYFVDSMILVEPYFKYEQYDHSNNLETMFGKNGVNASSANANPQQFNIIFAIGRYVEQLTANFLNSNYKINKLGIYKCNLEYNDYSLQEKFSMSLNPLEITADSVYKTKERVRLAFRAGILPFGNTLVNLSINPEDTTDFDIQYSFQKLPLAMFNPYTISLTSFPFDRGTLELQGSWHVRNGNISSNNHLLILDPRLSKRVKKKGIQWIPMRLVMAIARERGNVIDYEIPISGSLHNPKFHWRDVILDIIKNIFVKPVTIPYQHLVRNVETEIENSLHFTWELRSSAMTTREQHFLKKMASFLKENPEATITVCPNTYATREKEHLLFYEAKKRYFMAANKRIEGTLSKADIEKVRKLSIKDSLFVDYLNNHTTARYANTIQEKCSGFIGSSMVNNLFDNLKNDRVHIFMTYFKELNVERQIHFASGKNVIPYHGFSFFKMDYTGVFPEFLLKAYNQMQDLNDEEPRKKFSKKRNINKSSK